MSDVTQPLDHDPLDLDHPIDLPTFLGQNTTLVNAGNPLQPRQHTDVIASVTLPLNVQIQAEALKADPTPATPHTSTVAETLNQRFDTHGSFVDNGAIMQALKETMRELGRNWTLLKPHQREALEMIQHKIGRILSGDPDFAEHWHDIAGYATLVENLLTTGKER